MNKYFCILMSMSLGLLLFFAGNANAQQYDYDITGKYIVAKAPGDFFKRTGDTVEVEKFYLCNIAEKESSKPFHVNINALENVIRFGIASSSEEFSEQRRCYVIMKASNYEETFYKVLKKLDVAKVVYMEEPITIAEYIEKLK